MAEEQAIMRKRGEVELIDLGELTGAEDLRGVVAGIEHVGPGLLKRWQIRARHFQVREMKRTRELRAGETPETAPHLWILDDDGKVIEDAFGIFTEEGELEFRSINRKCLEDCIRSLTGREGLPENVDASMLAQEVENLGASEHLAKKAMEVQRLRREQFPAAEDLGHVPDEPATSSAA